MLNLNMYSGEYFTIGENIIVQIFRDSGGKFIVSIDAPRNIPIVRGEVLERQGAPRPARLLDKKPACPSDRIHNAKQLEKHLARKEAAEAAKAEP